MAMDHCNNISVLPCAQKQAVCFVSVWEPYFRLFSDTGPLFSALGCPVVMDTLPTGRIFRALAEGDVDLVIAPDYPRAEADLGGLGRLLLAREHLMVTVPKDSPLSDREELTLDDLAGKPFIHYPAGYHSDWEDALAIDARCPIHYVQVLPYDLAMERAAEPELFSFTRSTDARLLGIRPGGEDSSLAVKKLADPHAERSIFLWYRANANDAIEELALELRKTVRRVRR